MIRDVILLAEWSHCKHLEKQIRHMSDELVLGDTTRFVHSVMPARLFVFGTIGSPASVFSGQGRPGDNVETERIDDAKEKLTIQVQAIRPRYGYWVPRSESGPTTS